MESYIKADTNKRRELLKDVEKIDINAVSIPAKPVDIDKIEWFFSTKELCRVIYDLKDADEIKINPGLVSTKQDWNIVGFKGGSEPGVINYTHVLQKEKDKDVYSVSVTVNDTANLIDENKAAELTSRLISLIGDGKI